MENEYNKTAHVQQTHEKLKEVRYQNVKTEWLYTDGIMLICMQLFL